MSAGETRYTNRLGSDGSFEASVKSKGANDQKEKAQTLIPDQVSGRYKRVGAGGAGIVLSTLVGAFAAADIFPFSWVQIPARCTSLGVDALAPILASSLFRILPLPQLG